LDLHHKEAKVVSKRQPSLEQRNKNHDNGGNHDDDDDDDGVMDKVVSGLRLRRIVKENHGRSINQIAFNPEPQNRNLVATVGDNQVPFSLVDLFFLSFYLAHMPLSLMNL
jgi:hypothetical protein